MLTAALVAAIGVFVATRSGAPAPDPCPTGTLVVLRASDTALARVRGDTLFVVAGDTAGSVAVIDSTLGLPRLAFEVDRGAEVQLATVCAPVDSAYHVRLVPAPPDSAPPL